MRFVELLHIAALITFSALLSACPKKDDVLPEPAPTATSAPPTGADDKAGAEAPTATVPVAATPTAPPEVTAAPAAPIAKPKKKEDQGGW
jgi:hypothetical protein